MSWQAAAPSKRRLAGIVAQAAWHTVADKRVRAVTALGDVPPRIEAITPAWLTAALGSRAQVRAVTVRPAPSATSVRGVLEISYDGNADGLPATLFAKSTPTLVTRLANGASATSLAEARFMMELRPQLEVEVPRGYYCAADPRSFRSIQLLEHLRDAHFADVHFAVDRAMAEDAIDLLADVHRTFAAVPLPGWLRTQPAWWTMATQLADLRRSNDIFLASPEAPAALRDSDAVWRAFERSIGLHSELDTTLIHSDVHLANWYASGTGRMGLCDWQCVSIGHWSLDVAYALATLLAVEDRRAWERELLARYLERSGMPESEEEAWLRYRQQLIGALLKWSPTLHRPAGFPEMQPPELARELLRRITTAMTDLDALSTLRRSR